MILLSMNLRTNVLQCFNAHVRGIELPEGKSLRLGVWGCRVHTIHIHG
jgi:hypothetical protein